MHRANCQFEVQYLPESSTPSDCDARPILIRIVSVIVCPWRCRENTACPARPRYTAAWLAGLLWSGGLLTCRAGAGAAPTGGSIYILNQTGDSRSGAAGRRQRWTTPRRARLRWPNRPFICPTGPTVGCSFYEFAGRSVSRLIDVRRLAGAAGR